MKANRFLLFILACVLSIGTGWAKSTKYYEATVTKTGSGTVYISKTNDFSGKKTSISGNSGQGVITGSGTLYLYAEPANGWVFQKWTGSGINEDITIPNPSVSITYSSRYDRYPTQLSYNATFVQETGYIKVKTNPGGNANINNIQNTQNATVTITAYGEYNKTFNGWTVEGDDISSFNLDLTKPSLTFTNNGKHVTFTANWKNTNVSYYRIKDGNGKYLKMVGKCGTLTASASNANISLSGALQLTNQNVISDPATIFKVETTSHAGSSWTDLNLYSQGLNTKSIIGDIITNAGYASQISNKLTLIWNGQNGYTIKHESEDFYLQSTGGNVSLKSAPSDAKNNTWYFEPVDGSTSTANLAVTAEKTIGDKFYATLFVSFPFECADGMKAYYVADIVDNVAQCNTNGITSVPAFTPIILEWTAGNGYVLPINTDNTQVGDVTSNAITQGWWKGCINLYTTGGSNPNLRTCYFDRSGNMTDAGKTLTFDNAIMRVMDADGGSLVMNKNFTQGAEMPSNKSYVEKNPVEDLYMVIFPLELDETLETDRNLNAIFAEVSVKRTFNGPKEGADWSNWNTLCLPFDLDETEISSLFGECELKALDNFWATDDGTLHLRFKDATEIECGQPYMIRVKKSIADLALHNKWVNTEKDNKLHLTTDDYTMDFQGSYDYLDGTNGNYVPRNAFIINSNLFYYVDSNVKMKGFRAYFMPEAKATAKSPVKAMKIAEGEPTGINNISFEGLEDGTIYNPQGVRLNSIQRGVNIVNGKKIIR